MGKGKVTPTQTAFIIERYLSDNNFSRTLSTFRSEVSHLLSEPLLQKAPKSLLTLRDILDEFITLKEQRVILEQEKLRVDGFLKGIENLMEVYNNTGGQTVPLMPVVPQIQMNSSSSAGYLPSNSQCMMSATKPINTITYSTNFSTPTTTNQTWKRRKTSKTSATSKRSSTSLSTNQLKATGTELVPRTNNASNNQEASVHVNGNNVSSVQVSNVAKCLFSQPIQTPINSSIPKTPTRAIRLSPVKQMAYHSAQRNNHTSSSSPSKANSNSSDHVKKRLDFDGSNNTAINSEKYDLDLPNVDAFCADFNISQFYLDISLSGFIQPAVNAQSGLPDTSENGDMEADQHMSDEWQKLFMRKT